MALSPEALDDLKKLIATQIGEAMSSILPQQISQQLTLEREKQAKEATKGTSDSEGGSTPTPSDAMRICKGKGVAGTARFQAIRNLRPTNAEKEQRVPRQRVHAELSDPEDRAPRRRPHAAPRRPTQTIAGQRVYIGLFVLVLAASTSRTVAGVARDVRGETGTTQETQRANN
ncbi:unnamed protein product [Cochlearia groenlandica]